MKQWNQKFMIVLCKLMARKVKVQQTHC